MNPLCLLAELHGGGNVTAERLRRSGMNELADVSKHKPRELARMLYIAERPAARLIREAQKMLQGELFESASRLLQLPRYPVLARSHKTLKQGSTNTPIVSGFKADVVDLVAKHFR